MEGRPARGRHLAQRRSSIFGKIADKEFFPNRSPPRSWSRISAAAGGFHITGPRSKTGPNEHHDLAIYGLALACHLLWDAKKPEDWQELILERGGEPEKEQADLAELWGPDRIKKPADMEESQALPGSNARSQALARLAALNKEDV